jgi:2-keto-4-pentenoate hydratase/2-oxohepta-3-ene-1,7-dioic acid hydratase in catechol pathway
MHIAKFLNPETQEHILACQLQAGSQWQKIDNQAYSVFDLVDMSAQQIQSIIKVIDVNELSKLLPVLPFQPSAYRDFMLYEKHAIDAARGFVKKYIPKALPIVKCYEKVFSKPFPKLKPAARYYQHPIYYMGNHLNMIPNLSTVAIPEYTRQLDYELEIAAFITKPLKNATLEQAREAIGGFLILNDFSARDVQLDEIKTGFGPMKTKNFASALSSFIVSKNSIIDQIDNLTTRVFINNQLVAESQTHGKLYSFEQAIVYASWEEQLHAGELFGSGTVPGCTGIENGQMLNKGDTIRLEVEHLGTLENTIK